MSEIAAVFDANLVLGRTDWRPIGTESVAAMLATMDRFGIDRGLVSHLLANVHEPECGNDLLFAAVAGHEDRLLPAPVVDLNDGGAWRSRVAEWEAKGARALRLAPAFYRNSLAGDAAADLAHVALAHHWPVVVAIETVRGLPWVSGRPSQALEFAQRFADVPVIALGCSRAHWYEVTAALVTAPNLYMDVTYIETGLALEQLVSAGLSRRLLHGSNYGACYANVCMERVRHSSLSVAEKAAILRTNGEALFPA